jgi:hypothetical protein
MMDRDKECGKWTVGEHMGAYFRLGAPNAGAAVRKGEKRSASRMRCEAHGSS